MKTNLDKLFKTNKSLEINGVDIEIEGVTFKCRRFHAGSTHVKAAYTRFLKPYQRHLQSNTISEALADKLDKQVFIAGALIGWTGLTDDQGIEIPFTEENALELFTELPELYTSLQNEATKLSNFMLEDREELGND